MLIKPYAGLMDSVSPIANHQIVINRQSAIGNKSTIANPQSTMV